MSDCIQILYSYIPHYFMLHDECGISREQVHLYQSDISSSYYFHYWTDQNTLNECVGYEMNTLSLNSIMDTYDLLDPEWSIKHVEEERYSPARGILYV